MVWIYKQEDGYEIRTCDICKASQVKTDDEDWAVYLTYERVLQSHKCFIDGIIEYCFHTPHPDSR